MVYIADVGLDCVRRFRMSQTMASLAKPTAMTERLHQTRRSLVDAEPITNFLA